MQREEAYIVREDNLKALTEGKESEASSHTVNPTHSVANALS